MLRFPIWLNISPIVGNTDSLDFHPYEINLTLSILYWRCHIILNITMTSITPRDKRKCAQQWLPIRPRFGPKFFSLLYYMSLKAGFHPASFQVLIDHNQKNLLKVDMNLVLPLFKKPVFETMYNFIKWGRGFVLGSNRNHCSDIF